LREFGKIYFLRGWGGGKRERRSRFPEGMTEREARAKGKKLCLRQLLGYPGATGFDFYEM
jgi:hypothetical protein